MKDQQTKSNHTKEIRHMIQLGLIPRLYACVFLRKICFASLTDKNNTVIQLDVEKNLVFIFSQQQQQTLNPGVGVHLT